MTGLLSLALPLAVGIVALVYATVGHAGATGYIAVLTLAGMEPAVIRPTALVLNVFVAAIGTVQFARAGHFQPALFRPLAIASVPAAALGGMLTLPHAAFESVIGIVLLASALWIAVETLRPADSEEDGTAATTPSRLARLWLGLLGGGIGLLSGLTGVGGGVFLTPALLVLRVAPVRTVAAVSAAFILVNSVAGLGGRIVAGATMPTSVWPLVVAAVAGGLVGARLGAFRLAVPTLRAVLAVVLTFAGLKLLAAAWI
jgi:uncharacterized membrane protein YfcA